eukprot:5314931-Alexandrium_andersonii.AAC.1
MSASLVGSEMCIRDRCISPSSRTPRNHSRRPSRPARFREAPLRGLGGRSAAGAAAQGVIYALEGHATLGESKVCTEPAADAALSKTFQEPENTRVHTLVAELNPIRAVTDRA